MLPPKYNVLLIYSPGGSCSAAEKTVALGMDHMVACVAVLRGGLVNMQSRVVQIVKGEAGLKSSI